ncbi:tetratricopeptide repeat protein [Actinomyces sp. ZJ308]|uniref:tetratricopeptide repeat protein n=1 Tax=Actinomyces sp. ZJ308 TaxID=2708342 RepID=UPI0014221DF1|nr:tetratricopeptide repeat protein [Actinomyces sp. ZJ308]
MSDDVYTQEITRASRLIEAGQDERASQILTRLLASHPSNAGATYMALAYAYSGAGRLEDAETAARRAIAELPHASEAHQLLAYALVHQDREAEAERPLRTALELSPENDSPFYLMATALTRMERTEEALLYAREALRLAPESADNHAVLAAALRSSDPEAANLSLQEALRLDPRCEDALLLQFDMLNRGVNPREAAKALAAYTAHAPNPARASTAVNSFLIKFMSVPHVGQFWCALLAVTLLVPVRLANLPNGILLLPLVLTATLTCWATITRIQTFHLYFRGRCLRMLRACIRQHRYLALWGVAVPMLWIGFVIGVIRAMQGDDVVLVSVAGASLAHLALGWAGILLAPLLQRRSS